MGTFIRGGILIKIIELVSHYYNILGVMLIRQSRVHCSVHENQHIGHFRWLGPNVWWEISQIWIEYIKPIGQMSDESWKFFRYTALCTWHLRYDARGGTRSGFIQGCAAPGSEPLPYFRENRTLKTYPILGKSHNPGHPKRSGLQKHTLF